MSEFVVVTVFGLSAILKRSYSSSTPVRKRNDYFVTYATPEAFSALGCTISLDVRGVDNRVCPLCLNTEI